MAMRTQGLQDADAADLCQEVLSAVAGAVGRLEYDPQRGTFRSWLFTIIRRKLSNWRRSQRNQRDVDHAADNIEQCARRRARKLNGKTSGNNGSSLGLAQVRTQVTDLSWQAFWRTFIDGQPCKRVAADLGLSVGAVYVIRGRVLARLKEFVQSARALMNCGEEPCPRR